MKRPEHAKKVFEGVLFDIYQWDQELFDGTTTTFEQVERVGGVQLICITKEKKIILYDEDQPLRPKRISMPGGQIDRGEQPIVAAKRELLEEMGAVCSSVKLYKEVTLGSKVICPTYYFICYDVEKIQEPQWDGGERIEPFEISFEELFEKVEDKRFTNKQFRDMLFRIKHSKGELESFREELFGKN
jgi:ADP-ribose pyrophosphatase